VEKEPTPKGRKCRDRETWNLLGHKDDGDHLLRKESNVGRPPRSRTPSTCVKKRDLEHKEYYLKDLVTRTMIENGTQNTEALCSGNIVCNTNIRESPWPARDAVGLKRRR